MARKKRAEAQEDDEPALEISSLIDVCFLLLIYFLVTTTIQKSEQDTSMRAPGNSSDNSPPDLPPLVIVVGESGQISKSSDGQLLPLDEPWTAEEGIPQVPLLDAEVSAFADAAAAQGTKPVVQLRSENLSKMQRNITVLDVLSKYKIKDVAITDLLDPE